MHPTTSGRPYSPMGYRPVGYRLMGYRRGPGRFLRFLVGVLLAIYIFKNPVEAAANAKGLVGLLQAGTESFFSFVEEVGRAQ